MRENGEKEKIVRRDRGERKKREREKETKEERTDTHLSKFGSGLLFLHSSMSDEIIKHFSCTHRGTTICSSNMGEIKCNTGSKVAGRACDLSLVDLAVKGVYV